MSNRITSNRQSLLLLCVTMLSACIVVNVVLLKLAVGDSLKTNGVAFASSQKKFAICMLTKDDNHYWPEFLAYHMTFLPLQRMIVVIDPTSRTSPLPIFDRFAPYINITVVNDTQLGLHRLKPLNDKETYLRLQRLQIEDCTMRLRKEGWRKSSTEWKPRWKDLLSWQSRRHKALVGLFNNRHRPLHFKLLIFAAHATPS